jgi:hypothetical protein
MDVLSGLHDASCLCDSDVHAIIHARSHMFREQRHSCGLDAWTCVPRSKMAFLSTEFSTKTSRDHGCYSLRREELTIRSSSSA